MHYCSHVCCYRYIHKISTHLYLSAALMFSPTPKGKLHGGLANRHYDFLRAISGAALEEANQDMEYAIVRKRREELSMYRFAPLPLNTLLPILRFSVYAVGSIVLFLILEISFFNRQGTVSSVRLICLRFQTKAISWIQKSYR